MTTGLHIDSVHIEGFRGIADRLDLDLTAPVTLVFAPNGTGKTTLCEAIEWLVTAQVDRLRHGASFDQELLKSKFETSNTPKVSARLRTPERQGVLTRTLASASWNGDGPTAIGALLAQLAPAAAAPDANSIHAIRLRQHYLRGTRFLTGEALGALVDSDETTVGRRAQVFADLLGIRHLLEAERYSARFAAEMAQQTRVLQTALDQLIKDEAELRAQIASQDNANTSAFTELAAAEQLLAINPQGAGDLEARLQAAAAASSRLQHDSERRDEALLSLAREWSRWEELDRRQAVLQARERTDAEIVGQRLKAEETAGAALAVAEEAVKRLTDDLRKTDQARTTVRHAHGVLSERLAALRPFQTLDPATYDRLKSIAPEADWTESDRAARLSDLTNARAAAPRITGTMSQLADLEGRRQALLAQAMSRQAFEALGDRVRDLETLATTASAELQATTGPVARLQAAGAEFAEHLHGTDSADCPLCGENWKQVEALRSAIAATLAQGPALVRAAQALAKQAADEVRDARQRLTEAAGVFAQAERLERDAAELRKTIDRDTALFVRLEIAISTVDLGVVISAAETRLAVGAALAAFIAAVACHREVFGSPGERLWADGMTVDDVMRDLLARLDARQVWLDGKLVEAQTARDTASTALIDLRGILSVEQVRLSQCRHDLVEVDKELSRLQDLWVLVAGDATREPDGLEKLKLDHEQTKARLSDVNRNLAVGRSAVNAEVRRSRLAELQAAIGPARNERDRLAERQADGVALEALFRDTYATISHVQIGGLSRVVNALFSRMHANRVVDQIDLGVAEAFLRWGANAGGSTLDPGRDFSQGQRQDLALSLFLARARGLGGTFFLDEPLAHLDDLNRVGLLDVFRAVAVENASTLNLVITTASRNVARHMVEKFGSVAPAADGRPMLRVIELVGNGRLGVSQVQAYPRAV